MHRHVLFARIWRRFRAIASGFGARIFLGYFAVIGVFGYIAILYFADAVKPAIRQTLEATMVQETNLLAELLGRDPELDVLLAHAPMQRQCTNPQPKEDAGSLDCAMHRLQTRDLQAKIYGVMKPKFEQRIYITDAAGIVKFDSDGTDIGADYSQWQNVRHVLAGAYGVRSSHTSKEAPAVMHVSAALRKGGTVAGVVSISQPVVELEPFVALARSQLLKRAAVGLIAALLVGTFFAFSLSRGTARLVQYAHDVGSNARTSMPKVSGELHAVAAAIDTMRQQLDGKAYVESSMQTFAHEVKSPLAAIVASAELLEGELPATQRLEFARDVQAQAQRIDAILSRLRELALVEQRRTPQNVELLDLTELVQAQWRGCAAQPDLELTIECAVATLPEVQGEKLLVELALRNVLQNAVEFAERPSTICVTLSCTTAVPYQVTIEVLNRGSQVPAYAMHRVFERFYSLARPNGASRSTGLGLALVREVAQLHGGSATLRNSDNGVICEIRLATGGREVV
jgi:two-component system, OmpR family, sensor histidine kinase CreC